MAQQTINIGASPNDGTGTPLRTAFQYTNSNFSELYTAVGPSGNNIVVPGSATITGDLTVDTSTLKVDSANNRVGIGTASPALLLDVNGSIQTASGSAGGLFQFAYGASASSRSWRAWNDVSANGDFQISTSTTRTGSTYSDRYRIDVFGVHEWSNTSGLAMTLNSTGLGVGTIPGGSTGSSKIAVVGGATYDGNFDIIANFTNSTASAAKGVLLGYNNSTNNGIISAAYGSGTEGLTFWTHNGSSWGQRMELTATGNVGIGVTPSAWGSPFKALQVSRAGLRGSTATTGLSFNAYFDGTGFKYIAAGLTAQDYYQNSGSHVWQIAGIGANANDPIMFTPAMTLDASGNLLVGKSVSLFSTVGVEASGTGFISATNSASTNATTNLSVYSTGAAAFRFYVGLGGTVFATNTTISAISDARLKENVQDIDVGLGAILALKPRKFDWKAGKGKDIKGDRGFIAQEFEQVFPNLIDEWKDPAPEGEAPYKSVRQDLIPVLVKAIQELAAEVNALKNA